MCGIAGAYFFGERISRASLYPFMNSMRHRGPDGSGDFIEGNCWLGHLRLSIIDQSDNSAQPMSIKTNDNKQLTISFNGEIYNHIELREKLISLGHHFQTRSDTEVVLRAFNEWGENCQNLFNGIWAFAIYNSKNKELFISRDRFGVKPVYTFIKNKSFFFASEVKSFLSLPGGYRLEVNSSLINFLGERTHHQASNLASGVQRIPAGHSLTIKHSGRAVWKKWWDTQNYIGAKTNMNYTEQAEQFTAILNDAIKIRLRADADTCTALSGGLDSSSILALIHKNFSNITSQKRAHKAFILDFCNTKSSEISYAKDLTGMHSVESTIVECHSDKNNLSATLIDDCIYHSEQYKSLFIGPYLLYQAMKDERYKVSIDGHGADELLGGYIHFLEPSIYDTLKQDAGTEEFYAISNVWKNCGASISPREFWQKKFIQERRDFSSKLSHLDKARYDQFNRDTLPWILDTYDKIPMAHGVEVRSPFLDWRFVKFAFSLPTNSILGNGFTKKILRDVMKNYLPSSISCRTSKIGFGSPMAELVSSGILREYTLDIIHSREYIESNYFDGAKNSEAIDNYYKEMNFLKIASAWPTIQATILSKILKDRAHT